MDIESEVVINPVPTQTKVSVEETCEVFDYSNSGDLDPEVETAADLSEEPVLRRFQRTQIVPDGYGT